MKLKIGDRITGSGAAPQPGGYIVTEVIRVTPWYGLYRGKKVFGNFDFSAKRLREADQTEWLDVLLRTVEYPFADDAAYAAARRRQARYEVQRILGNRPGQLWPEPVDLIELPYPGDGSVSTGDGGPAEGKAEPVVVFADPHGETLAQWRHHVLPLASVLGVLAEILAFMAEAHEDGLVLNGLNAETVVVDRAGRAHYIGTDMAFAAAAAPQREAWPRFFPPERYAREFAAPECCDLRIVPDRRCDLYAWAGLVSFLLAGEAPAPGSLQPGGSRFRFEEDDPPSLERAFRQIPAMHVRNWAEQLGVHVQGLVDGWPENIVEASRLLLHPQPDRRPASVAECRLWLVDPPPPPVDAVLALRTGPESVKVLVDLRDTPAGLDMVVRRGDFAATPTPADGELVSDGPLSDEVEITLPSEGSGDEHGNAMYAVFTRRRSRSGRTVHSMAVSVRLMEVASADLLRVIEEQVSGEHLDQPEPPVVELIGRALGEVETFQLLLSSGFPVVRAWAIRRLGGRFFWSKTAGAAADLLLWRGLHDPVEDLRLEAARAIIGTATQPDPALLKRITQTIGGDDIDACIQAAQTLRRLGINEDLIHGTVEALEGDRPTTCPECGQEVTGRDRPGHLMEFHGYVEALGSLLPRTEALQHLWRRVLGEGHCQAHSRLVELLQTRDAYLSELAKEVERAEELPLLEQRLASCIAGEMGSGDLVQALLRSDDDTLRRIGRCCLLAELVRTAGTKPTAADLRLHLDEACPVDLLEQKILLCLELPALGVDAWAVNACLTGLQGERPALCDECGARVKRSEVEAHLRAEHGIFEFRGVRRSYARTRNALLRAVCRSSPDLAAWKMLEALGAESKGANAARWLASWLGKSLGALGRFRREHAMEGLGHLLAGGDRAADIISALLRPVRRRSLRFLRQQLALETVRRLPPPVPDSLVEKIVPILGDRQLSRGVRHAAVVALWQTTGTAGAAAERLLAAYVRGTGKLRAIDKLHRLEQQVGRSPAIDVVCSRLEDQVRMTCPRCNSQLRRRQMIDHLWDRHRLVLEGRRVRDPWRVIEDWLEDYRLEKDVALLQRCRELAEKVDADHGPSALQRLLLRHGVEDRQALTALVEQARHDHACLCPYCYHLIPVPEAVFPAPLKFSKGTLHGHGYEIELSETGLWPQLRIDSPQGSLYLGREPGKILTRKGGLVFIAGPFAILTLVLTQSLADRRIGLGPALVLALGVGLFVGALIHFLWPVSLNIRDRLIANAWALLVGDSSREEEMKSHAGFVAGLARSSLDRGDAGGREEVLEEALEWIDELARRDRAFVPHLAALWQLRFDDLTRQGRDPLVPLVEEVSRCFTAKMPLRYAAHLLQELSTAHRGQEASWKKEALQRLPILLCERAFAAGLEPADLRELGDAFPELRWALGLDNREHLAHLRLLWSLRSLRPWQHWGAATVFELVESDSGAKWLARFPDLLFAVEPLGLSVCSRGLWFQDVWFGSMPAEFAVRRDRDADDYELILGPHHFRWKDQAAIDKLQNWFRYFFREFLPQGALLENSQGPEAMGKLQSKNGIACPGCKRKVLARLGATGIPLEEKAVATWI